MVMFDYDDGIDNAMIDDKINDYIDENINIIEEKEENIKDYIYNNISGTFHLQHLTDNKVNMELEMNNKADEIAVGTILLGNPLRLDLSRLGTLGNIQNYTQTPFINNIKNYYNDNIQYINNNDLIGNGNNIPNNIPNNKPENNINYIDIYKDIELKQIEYKELSKYKTLNYEIKNNCVYDGIKKKFPNIKIKLKQSYKYPYILKLMKKNKKNCIVRDFDNEIIEMSKVNKYITDKNTLDFKIIDEHIYILSKSNNEPKKNKFIMVKLIDKFKGIEKRDQIDYIIINSIKDLDKYNNINILLDNFDSYNKLIEEIKKDNILIDYDYCNLYYKSNVIRYNPTYLNFVKIIKKYNYKSLNIFNCIDSKLKLRGYLSEENFNYFINVNKIITFSRTDNDDNIKLDINNAYPSKLYDKTLILPVPIISDEWKKYNNEPIINYYIYYIKLEKGINKIITKNYNNIFGTFLKVLINNGVKLKILRYFASSLCRQNDITQDDIDKNTLRQYIGWLRKNINNKTNQYEVINPIDKKILELKYKERVKFYNKDNYYIANINDSLIIKKTGILVNLYIMDLVNMELYLMDKEIKRLNKGIILNNVKTDCLGYIYDKPIILPMDKIKKGVDGCYKIEKQNDFYYDLKKIELLPINKIYRAKKPKINKYKLNNLDVNDIDNLISNNKSFLLSGRAGFGKTYTLINNIIPKLNELNKKYFITSTTIENAEDLQTKLKSINVETIQNLLNKLTIEELTKKLKDISYIIIDESSQLTQDIYKILEYIILNLNTKIILIGDKNQCKGTDAYIESWINTNYILNLCDMNLIILKKHKNIRYCDELDNLLTFIENEYNISKIKNYVLQKIKIITKHEDNINLAYYNKTCDNVKSKFKKDCYTVHSYQGKTIKGNYTIFDFMNMSKELIFTALSRATNINNISLYIENINK